MAKRPNHSSLTNVSGCAPEGGNIAAVKAAGELSYEDGVKKERELFMELMSGTQSAAMRHYFFAERAANKIDDVPKDTPLIPIKKVGVIGAGTMGGGIAMCFAEAGIATTVVDSSGSPPGASRRSARSSRSRPSPAASRIAPCAPNPRGCLERNALFGPLKMTSFLKPFLNLFSTFSDLFLNRFLVALRSIFPLNLPPEIHQNQEN